MSEKLSAMQKQLEIAHDSKVNKEQFASLKSELKSALASKLELESQLQAGNSTDTQIKELRVNLEEKLQTIANLDRKYQDMRQKFKESLKIIKEYELTDAKYQQKLTQLIERNKQIQSEFSEVELKLKNCGCEIAAKNEEINQLSAQLSNQPISNDFTTEIEELKRLNEEIRETLGQKDGKIQQLQAYNDQIEAQFQVQLSTVNFLKEQLIMSQTKLKQSEVSLATLKTEAEDLRSQYTQACTKLEKQNSSQKDFNSEISTEIAELCKNLELYRVEVESKTKTIEELQGHLTKAHLALGLKVSECCENETVLPKPKSDYITSVEENLKEFQLEIDSIIQTFVTADTNEYQERLALLTDSCASLQTAVIEKISELDRRMAQFQFSLAKIQKQEIAPESSLQGTKNDLNTRLDKAQLESTVLQSINGRLSRISTVVDKLKFGETHKKEELPPGTI